MYVASSRPGKADFRKRLPSTVFALGTVSLLTDVSAEMITAFLPVYLLFTLQLGYAQFGLLDGIYTGATAVLRLVGGGVADKFRKPKAVAAAGYGLSAATKLFFPLAGASAFGIGALMAADRAGKGIRTAPRDAMISLATPEDRLGAAFGVHRSMDTFGALLGPLITFLLLAQIGMVPGPIFAVSAAFAVIGLIVLISFVREPKTEQPKGPRPSFKAGLDLLTDRSFRRTTISAGLLGLATISDAFVYVLVQKATGISLGYLPLLPLGTAVVFLAAAAPLGKLSDKLGRWRMFLVGHGLLLGVYALLFIPEGGKGVAIAALLLHGLFYAATDGVLSAKVSETAPESLRASGLSVVQTGQALGRLVSSVAFGLLLQYSGIGIGVTVALVALTVTLIIACGTNREQPASA
ncbi:MFS transporter [Lentzea jiangxiensis]|uniref:Major Facilitator Superfamily protein n=1 Tax=Lentzea jiangxiensis TaxID=641025 RepID=A0A1H0PQI0_9PSEU|nr:MFS transporter [Lentzea jiangxiensis]SDP07254.1 Major Facilitator Superfamily protein [Lentzea jiangxiensis]